MRLLDYFPKVEELHLKFKSRNQIEKIHRVLRDNEKTTIYGERGAKRYTIECNSETGKIQREESFIPVVHPGMISHPNYSKTVDWHQHVMIPRQESVVY